MDLPILFISARTTDDDKIAALNIGGDDYIEKPYSLGVLLAKVKVVLKRFCPASNHKYSDEHLTVELEKKAEKKRRKSVSLRSFRKLIRSTL